MSLTSGIRSFNLSNTRGSKVSAMAWISAHKELVVGDAQGFLSVWDPFTDTLLTEARVADEPLVAIIPNGDTDLLLATPTRVMACLNE
jgi:hypothetical protein